MILYTTNINNTDARGYKNITLKSGDKYYAPTSALLWSFKYGNITLEQFKESFIRLMNNRIKDDSSNIDRLCKKDVVTLACYCDNGMFCHRLLLVDIIKEYCIKGGIDFEYYGEI